MPQGTSIESVHAYTWVQINAKICNKFYIQGLLATSNLNILELCWRINNTCKTQTKQDQLIQKIISVKLPNFTKSAMCLNIFNWYIYK